MRDIDNTAWQAFLELNERYRDQLPRIHEIPVTQWNRDMDEWTAALEQVRGDRFLMTSLRERARDTSAVEDLALLHTVLGGVVFDHGADLEALMTDPRVFAANGVEVRAALYLPEIESEADPYDAEAVEDEWRDLTRVGGSPTAAFFSPPTDRVFLLQIDLRALRRRADDDDEISAVLREHPLPESGLLQIFHTTVGDSRTDPDAPGGVASILHVSEGAVIDSHTTAIDRLFPTYTADIMVLPTFRHRPDAPDEVADLVEGLQEDVYRTARNGSYPPGYDEAFSRDPFAARAGAVTHLFGLQSPDSDLAPEDCELLARELPLTGPSDTHVLLIEVAGDRVFDCGLGEDGRLEIWIRASDLAQHDYSRLVSFIR